MILGDPRQTTNDIGLLHWSKPQRARRTPQCKILAALCMGGG